MPKGKSFDEILFDAERLIRVWSKDAIALGDITLESFQAMVTSFKTKRGQTEGLRTQLTRSVNETNDLATGIAGVTTRGLSGIRAQFGPDSTQYEEAGGTRTSDRKPRKPKGSGGSGTPKS